jgi:cation diffusion facilitator family transporter
VEPVRVVASTLLLNAALCVAHFAVWFAGGSQLVLAQGADSLTDLAIGAVLLVSVRVAARPRDEDHPFGHGRAEPIGALITAVLAFVLAIEVGRSAVGSLVARETPQLDGAAIGVLSVKLVVKLSWLLLLFRRRGGGDGQAMEATRLDTLNDVLTCGSSLVGSWLVRAGHPSIDSWFALPVAAYIAKNGFGLARASLRFLMGEAPSADVVARLRGAAGAVAGVQSVSRLRAHFVGQKLHVEATILIAAGSTAKQGHDIALDVQVALEADPLVGEVFIHLDTGEGKDGT